ncbi:unnamed protein product [Arabis nemorensis]|uniref:Uncharacterized protein n=1 Tax=Arabis nemorensis TaxID=586526 RepID=A0A565BRP5_9BRAS|nr:unnamed protein product [Arabis nemorensis]
MVGGVVSILPLRRVKTAATVGGHLPFSGSEPFSVLNRRPLKLTIISSIKCFALNFSPENMEKTIFKLCSTVGPLFTVEHIPARRNHESSGSRNFSGTSRRTIFSGVISIYAGNSLCPPELMLSSGILCTHSSNLRKLLVVTRFDLAPTPLSSSSSIRTSHPPPSIPATPLEKLPPFFGQVRCNSMRYSNNFGPGSTILLVPNNIWPISHPPTSPQDPMPPNT